MADPKTSMVNPEARNPLKYERVKRLLLDQINSGILKPGDMLPREVDLAEKMDMARNTVRQAMSELEHENYIRRVRGKGTIVCKRADNSLDKNQSVDQLYGLVLPELRTGLYQSLQAGLNNAMSSKGANIIVCDSRQDVHSQVDALLQLAHRRVAGVILVPISSAHTPVHHISFLQNNRVPLVFCHRRIQGVSAPVIGFSSFEIGKLSGKELAKFGHSRIAMIFSHASDGSEQRLLGLREAMQDVNGEVPDDFIYYDKSYRADHLPLGLEDRLECSIRKMLEDPKPPTAFVISADVLASITAHVLVKIGLSIPQDVSVIGFGNRVDRGNLTPYNIQSVTVDEYALGQKAFETLCDVQEGTVQINGTHEYMMPLEISEGNSIGPAN